MAWSANKQKKYLNWYPLEPPGRGYGPFVASNNPQLFRQGRKYLSEPGVVVTDYFGSVAFGYQYEYEFSCCFCLNVLQSCTCTDHSTLGTGWRASQNFSSCLESSAS
eukprot:scaffold321525_cov18-Prasinocladus_malaysianus.AAC.2